MKHLFMLVAAVTFWPLMAGAQIRSVCMPSPAIRKAYRADVADMALERIYQLKSPDTFLIEIPQTYQDTIMNAIAGVCNLDTAYEADSVFKHYCIHRYRLFMPKIMVKVDPGISWVTNWRSMNIYTGDTALDDFLRRYNIYLSWYWYDPRNSSILNDWGYFSSDHPINWKALGDSLKYFRGLIGYERVSQFGDGDNIRYSTDSVQRLRFVAGRGDCPSGCTERKIWTYSLSGNCEVTLDTVIDEIERDRRMPHCNLAPLYVHPGPLTEPVQLYPNPAHNRIYWKSTEAIGMIRITNPAGQAVLQFTPGTARSMDISAFCPGVYFVQIRFSDGHTGIARFMKE